MCQSFKPSSSTRFHVTYPISLDPSIYASSLASQARTELASRRSVSSTDSSASDLHRASSGSSNNSTSTSASSVECSNIKNRSKHRKNVSSGSLKIPRRFLKKTKPQCESEPVTTIVQLSISAPIIPPRIEQDPVLGTKPVADWQCSDLVVRCGNEVYHVDRVIMSYHSRWFAKVCAVVKSPVRSPTA